MSRWPTVPLGEVAEVVRGVTFSNGDTLSADQDGGVPILRAGNIRDSLLIDQDLVYVPARLVAPKQRMQTGDLAICMSSGSAAVVGKSAILEGDWHGSVGAFCAIVRFTGVLPRYGAYWFRSSQFLAWRDTNAKGANIQNLKAGDLGRLQISVPPLGEQERIVRLLDEADTIRNLRAKADQRTADLIPALFHQMFGDPVTNSMGWPVKFFVDLLEDGLRNGVSPSKQGTLRHPVLTLAAITGRQFDANARKLGLFSTLPGLPSLVETDQFLICRGSGNLNLVGRGKFPSNITDPIVYPDTMIAAKPNDRELTREYLNAIWETQLVRGYLESSARTTNGTHKINQTALEKLSLPVPPLELQARFAVRTREISAIGQHQRDSTATIGSGLGSLLHNLL